MLTRFFLVIICNFKFGFSYTIEFLFSLYINCGRSISSKFLDETSLDVSNEDDKFILPQLKSFSVHHLHIGTDLMVDK